MRRFKFASQVLSGLFLAGALSCSSPSNDTGGTNGGSGGNGGSKSTGGSGGSKSTGGSGGSKSTGGSGGSKDNGSGGASGSGGSSAGSSGDSGSGGSSSAGSGGSSDNGGSGGSSSAGSGGGSTDAGGGSTGDDGGFGVMLSKDVMQGDGCAGGKCQNPNCMPYKTPYPLNGFASVADPADVQPDYIPNNMIIPTFDDAPDGSIAMLNDDGTPNPEYANYGAGKWTRQLLAWAKANDLHFDVFLNGNNWCGDVTTNPECEQDIQEVLRNNNPGNHTIHHIWFESPKGNPNTGVDPNDLSSAGCGSGGMFDCDMEVMGIESLVDTLSNHGRSHLTRFRLPYGWPIFNGGLPAPGLPAAKALIPKYAVHVGWDWDSKDSLDPPVGGMIDSDTIVTNITSAIGDPGAGQTWGIMLMHGTYPWTFAAAKVLFDPKTGYLVKHGFKQATVEDVICWKYGMHSWDIVNKLTPGAGRTKN